MCPASAAHTPTPLDRALRAPVHRRQPGEIELPWIWAALDQKVVSRLPRYAAREFSMIVTPVIVSGTFDTVPGVGVGGEF